MNDRFLRACRREPVDATPVWFMRQAGRYMSEYRELRKRYSLLEICREPELAVAVTLQPVDTIEVDAAILFSDLLVPFTPMGLDFEFVKGEGPSIHYPIRVASDVDRLVEFEPREALAHVLETIRLLRQELRDRVPLIGFGGAPFTLAAYGIEGGPSTTYIHTKRFMYSQPQAWHRLCARFADVIADYMQAQVEAGAQAIQIFDSWAGALGRNDYREFALPHTRAIFERLRGAGVPLIHFGVGAAAILEDLAEAGGDVIGVDWRQPLDEAWARISDRAVQGNLDPTLLLGPRDRLFAATDDVLRRAGGRPGHIFNLGHGILPPTPLEHVQELAKYVHSKTLNAFELCPSPVRSRAFEFSMIAIIGGGIAGLAAAYELNTRSIPFRLFEAADRIGGLVHTQHVGGFTIEAGADSMLAQKGAGIELCAELGLTPRLISTKAPRTAFVLREGRLHPLPSPSMLGIPATWRQLAGYSLLPVLSRARVAMEPLVPVKAGAADESVGAFFRRRFGAATVDLLAQPLLGGIHAGDVETLSLGSLFPRLSEAEKSGRKVLRWVRQTTRGGHAGGAFRSLSSGMGELVEGIRRRLPGDAVLYHSPVTSLERQADGWYVTSPRGRERFDAVILACPASVARQFLAPIDPRASELCGQVRYVSTVSLGLGWRREAIAHPLDGSGFVVARATNAVRITACTWVSSKWEGRAPAGHVLLRAYMGGAHDASAVEMSDDALVDVAVRELSAILSISGPPAVARVNRWRDAGAQHEVGHRDRMNELEARLARHPGLLVTGSGFRSIGIPDCVADARAVASRLQVPGS